jgi:decaprenylphospho-beta-D-erythro-pentofuranosid-2-ulose 2-reductase
MRDALGSVQSVALFGATSEIGAAIVRALVADRARRIVLLGRHENPSLAADVRALGADVASAHFDALDLASHERLVEEAVAAVGGDLDLAVVAFGALGRQGDGQLDDAGTLQQVNGAGAVSVMARLAQRLRRQGHGTICLISSVAADRPRPSNYAYGASKAAADAFARGLRDSLAGSGVEVLIVRPGFVRTKMTAGLDAAPLATGPEQVASAVVGALRRRAPVAYVPPPLRAVGLALRLMPSPLLRRLPL